MPTYLFEVHYSVEGIKGVMASGGTARANVARELMESLGGTLQSFHFAFGATDAYVIAELPDDESAAAAAMTVSAGGGATLDTVVLLTPAAVDAAAGKRGTYRPPGG